MHKTDSDRDRNSAPDRLFPFQRTSSIVPESKLEVFCQRAQQKWQETVGNLSTDLHMICVVIGTLQSSLIMTKILSVLSCDRGNILVNVLRKILMNATVLALSNHNHSGKNNHQRENNNQVIIIVALLLLINEIVSYAH